MTNITVLKKQEMLMIAYIQLIRKQVFPTRKSIFYCRSKYQTMNILIVWESIIIMREALCFLMMKTF